MEPVSRLKGLTRKRGLKCEEEAGSRGQVRWGDLGGHPDPRSVRYGSTFHSFTQRTFIHSFQKH